LNIYRKKHGPEIFSPIADEPLMNNLKEKNNSHQKQFGLRCWLWARFLAYYAKAEDSKLHLSEIYCLRVEIAELLSRKRLRI